MRVVLVGGGGHASDVLGAFEAAHANSVSQGGAPHPVVGIVADNDVDDRRFSHRNVRQIGSVDDLPRLDVSHYIIAVGLSEGRRALQQRVASFGLQATTIIHPRAWVPDDVSVGDGTVVLAGVCVSPLARIGHHVYLSHGALIGHDCQVGDFATVLPGAAVSGDTSLGEGTVIGTKAAVVQGLKIGAGAMIGAGAVVLRDVPENVTAVGIPAKWKTQ